MLVKFHRSRLLWPWRTAASLLFCFCFFHNHNANQSSLLVRGELSCSVGDADSNALDPNLKPMTYDIGYGEQTFLAWVEPDVQSMYNGNPPASTKTTPKFTGLATKFINMSNQRVHLYWEMYVDGQMESMGTIEAFSATGTASHTNHIFVFATDDEEDPEILRRVFIGEHPQNIYVYDPYEVRGDAEATEVRLQEQLNDAERKLYYQWRDTLRFSEHYENFTGRSYLANYLRHRPKHYMWPADYFGQEHWVETKETHFSMMPADSELQHVAEFGSQRVLREDEPRLLQEYRDPNQSTTLNLTLKVLSVAPRVFEIPNFLSQVEVDHILQVAGGVTLSRSSIGDLKKGAAHVYEEESATADTRTSENSWIERERSPIFDAIYRRAADVMRIDEALLRQRDETEMPEWKNHTGSVAESLQLVHYAKTQKYTAHHDFGFSDLDGDEEAEGDDSNGEFSQGTRFATLLLYLNNVEEGGETTFPRWKNAESFDQLRVNPQEGKAVLFYSQLPDGNLDDFSQHAALSPRKGEKWLINLWVWDPTRH